MKKIIINIAKFFLNLIYFFIKLQPTKNRIVFMSMQSNKISLDFELLHKEITYQEPAIKVVFLCKKMKSSLSSNLDYIKYVFNMVGYVFKSMCYLAGAKVCVTESYCVPISILKHKKELKVIQVWHASGAVKKFGYQALNTEEGKSKEVAQLMCMHENYDYVIAPSEATKDIFSEAFNIEKEKIVKLGLPRLEYIIKEEYDKTEEIYNQYPELKDKKVILYVPTFRKGKGINLKEILNININNEKYKLLIKAHPLERDILPEEYKIDSKYTTFDLIKFADYIITDYSILSVEASILEKPVFLYLYDLEEYNIKRGLNLDLEKELKTFSSRNFEEIINKIETNNFDMEEIIRYKNKYIEIDITNTTKELAKFILSLI